MYHVHCSYHSSAKELTRKTSFAKRYSERAEKAFQIRITRDKTFFCKSTILYPMPRSSYLHPACACAHQGIIIDKGTVQCLRESLSKTARKYRAI